MEFGRFNSGGFYLHRINPRGNGGGKISAWFTDSGDLVDCEYIDTLNRSRKCGKADRAHCELLGNVWKHYGKVN